MTRPITPETRLKNRVRDLERQIDAYMLVAQHLEVWRYLENLHALSHLATSGLRRPEDLGGTISGTHSSSKPPAHDIAAYAQFKAELVHLSARARTIEGVLNGHKVA